MATLVFDIETVGESWEQLDETTHHVLTRWIESSSKTDAEREVQLSQLKDGLGFSPLTGHVVAIGLCDVERDRGVVFYETNGTILDEEEYERYVLKPRSEKAMLEDFWEGAKAYDTFVTFNGRGFDVPFLMLRSAIHGITPTRDLMDGRYLYQQRDQKHIDLQDQLTFYGAMYRRPSLHLFCRAFGIESPKGEGVSGDDVARLFGEGNYRDIARYNVRDVVATAALYEKWRSHLSPQKLRDSRQH